MPRLSAVTVWPKSLVAKLTTTPGVVLATTVLEEGVTGSTVSVGFDAGAVTTKLPLAVTRVALSDPYCACTAV